MISLMGNMLLHKLLAGIRKACLFAIIADETRYISNKEQLTIAIQWVSNLYAVREAWYIFPSTTLATLTVAIKDVLICCILPLSNCWGESYDGAFNMMGYLRGMATTLQKEDTFSNLCPLPCLLFKSLPTGCITKSQPIRNALDVTMELSKLILYSPKLTLVCKQEMSIEGTGLRPLCPTRWTIRTGL